MVLGLRRKRIGVAAGGGAREVGPEQVFERERPQPKIRIEQEVSPGFHLLTPSRQ